MSLGKLNKIKKQIDNGRRFHKNQPYTAAV